MGTRLSSCVYFYHSISRLYSIHTCLQSVLFGINTHLVFTLAGCQDGWVVKALDSSVHPLCSDTVRSPRDILSTFLFHKRNSLGDRMPWSDCLESGLAVGDPCLQASECSSPPLRWAWVRFPLLTEFFFYVQLPCLKFLLVLYFSF